MGMRDRDKTKAQLIDELAELRGRVSELETQGTDEKWLQTLLYQSIQGLLIIQDFRIIFTNPAFADISGYSIEELLSIPQDHVRAMVHPEDQAFVWGRFRARLKGKDIPARYEYRGIRKDGSVRWLEMVATRIEYRGKPAIYGALVDITERKRAEEALRESEERYRNLFEQSRDALYITTREGSLLEINQSFLDLFGYSRKKIKGVKAQQMYANPDDRPAFQREIESKGSLRDFELKLRKKDGTVMDCLLTATVRRAEDGGILGYQGIIRDITEHKRADEAIKQSEAKYRTILEAMEEGYFEVDLAGNLTFFNDALCKISGYPREKLMGMNNRDYTAPETAKRMYHFFNEIYRTGNPARIMDYEVTRKDGSTIILELSASLMRDHEGTPIGVRGIALDVTERKRAEQEQKKLEAQLHHIQRMESIGTLAGGIAHNFNNILIGISGNTSLILLETDPTHPNYPRIQDIERMVDSASKLTRQLLGYARGGTYEVRPMNLNQVIKETANTFGAAKRDISIHQELAEDLCMVSADQGQIEQALLNLFVNAADAMPRGGELSITSTNVTEKDMRGKAYSVKPGTYALITVRDTGVGMDEKTAERLFEPFFTTKGFGKGTGLGLASTCGIIKAHGGYIDVNSKEGQGATFYVYLPASEKKLEEPVEHREHIVKGSGTILLVDDEAMLLEVGSQLFDELGYTVLTAHGGREAMEIYKEHGDSIDLVILDMIMPDMGGGKTFDMLKEINPGVRVLLSSGYSIDGQAQEIMARGCDGFIQKPFRVEELSQKISEIVQQEHS
jgi:two-component system cell cycle sensor histidine kinase/response regulator CckA